MLQHIHEPIARMGVMTFNFRIRFNNNNILYVYTLSIEETIFKCVYSGTVLMYRLRTLYTMIRDNNMIIHIVHTVEV